MKDPLSNNETAVDFRVSYLFIAECRNISMGQGQEVHARRLMAQGMANGGWLLLQNCHLSLDYVEEVLDLMIETETIHQEFRLWVTTEVHKKFPINFLQVKKILRCSQTLQMFLWFFVLCKHL